MLPLIGRALVSPGASISRPIRTSPVRRELTRALNSWTALEWHLRRTLGPCLTKTQKAWVHLKHTGYTQTHLT
eukprot:5946916-Amphidinium_carterae.1